MRAPLTAPVLTRVAPFFAFGLLATLSSGCVDAPVTPAQVSDDGQLRPTYEAQSLVNTGPAAEPLQAQNLQLTAVLARESDGALVDTARFEIPEPTRVRGHKAGSAQLEDSPAVHLHLRADNIDESRPVSYVWIHGDERFETMGFIGPSDTLSLAASQPLSEASLGAWTVEVHAQSASGAKLLYEREFEVVVPLEEDS